MELTHSLMLQAHMDMVCETDRAEGFDFAGNSGDDIVFNSRISIQQSIAPLFLRLSERYPLLVLFLQRIFA